MPKVKKIFTEYGLDFDNNKYGFGRMGRDWVGIAYPSKNKNQPPRATSSSDIKPNRAGKPNEKTHRLVRS